MPKISLQSQTLSFLLSTIVAVLSLMFVHVSPAHGQSVVATIPTPASPQAIAVNTATNKIYVGSSGAITVIDGATNTVATIAIPAGNIGAIAVNQVTNKIYVSSITNNNILVIDGLTNQFSIITDPNASGPSGIGVNSVTNRIYVANGSGSTVTVINGATGTTTTIADPFISHTSNPVVVNSITNKIYVGSQLSGSLVVIDGATNSTTDLYTPDRAYALAVNSVTNKIYVANLYFNLTETVVDGLTNATTTIQDSSPTNGVAVNSVTNKIYFTNINDDHITVIDGATNASTIITTQAGGPLAVNEVTNKIYLNDGTNIVVVDGATNSLSRLRDPNATGAYYLVVNPVTNRVYVANLRSNNVTVIDGGSSNRTPPSCRLSSIVAGPPVQLSVAMQDLSSGLQNISVIEDINASINIPTFTPGTTNTVLTTATKLNQSQGSNVGFLVTNVAGLSTTCDPVDFTLELEGVTEQHVFRSLPATEHYVRIVNGTPGVEHMTFLVNGHSFSVPELADGEEYMLDIGSAMLSGNPESAAAEQKSLARGSIMNVNNVVMHAKGRRGASAYVLIGDSSVK